MRKIWQLLLILIPVQLAAQEKFIFEGRIEYERKINVHRQVEPDMEDNTWFKEFISRVPVFHNSTFSLQFKEAETIYKLAGEMPSVAETWLLGPAKENMIYTDLGKHIRNSYKSVFEKQYLITDSLTRTDWRITDEKRTIAGLECRKAVGKICDSVYIVAFYAEEIPVSGGPESFAGLPGMILGLVIPRLHTTWFATKIVLTPPASQDFVVTAKGQRIQKSKLNSTLQSSLKDWGKYGERNIWWVML